MKKKEKTLITVQLSSHPMTAEDFGAFMRATMSKMNDEARRNPEKMRNMRSQPTALEEYTLAVMKELAHTHHLEEEAIKLNKAQAFPDILAGEAYGVEVKLTKEDRWSSTGSSIVESTRTKGIDRIYLLFGKMGGAPEFKCKPYEECMEDIAVTHSPRYRINMELEPGHTIFDKMGIPYDDLRKKDDIIEPVRLYYKTKAQERSKREMPWWIGSPSEDNATNINVRLWADVAREEEELKDDLLAQGFILFPEVLSSEFSQMALWLCTRHSILCHNIRDQFTAGGQYTLVNGLPAPQRIPHIIGIFVNLSTRIRAYLQCPSEALAEEIKVFHPELSVNEHTAEERIDIFLKEVELIVESKLRGKRDKSTALAKYVRAWFESDSIIS